MKIHIRHPSKTLDTNFDPLYLLSITTNKTTIQESLQIQQKPQRAKITTPNQLLSQIAKPFTPAPK